ncbi:MAG TPA: hypothetical protein VFC44_16975 [Candidatus Saccharimonadales bacterium]|nr:hypothetical protein [Candidatus Saccharimonadales bacterium]
MTRTLLKAARTLAQIIIFGCLIGWVLNHTARPGSTKAPAGFWLGMLHGAIMPCTVPNLVAGFNIDIYAPNNTGLTYKLGYACGVNACGLVFFGFLFLQITQWREKRALRENRRQKTSNIGEAKSLD